MKTILTIEQSEYLSEYVNPSLASKSTPYIDGKDSKPLFTIENILDIIPKQITYKDRINNFTSIYNLVICYNLDEWSVGYKSDTVYVLYNSADELIDALYESFIEGLEEGLWDSDKISRK